MTQCHDTMSPYTAVILSGYFVILSGVGGGNKEKELSKKAYISK